MERTYDIRIKKVIPLISPAEIKLYHPMTEKGILTVVRSRETVMNILSGKDPRMVAVVGPCSIHDTTAAMEYAEKLNRLRQQIEDRIFVVMRVYFEKPRTTLGWRGLIVDPYLNGSYEMETGLRIARKLLVDITDLGLSAGSEILDPIVPQYIADLITWASIGARTTESQIHREMASGLSMPVGFKNTTDGSLDNAINAMSTSASPHSFLGIDPAGRTCIIQTEGNPWGHVILRGGKGGPNYDEANVREVERLIRSAGLEARILVDCSHANSEKKQVNQEKVLREAVALRQKGIGSIRGVMIESFLVEGNQKIPTELSELRYGVSVTDECIGWEKTEQMLLEAYSMLSN